MSTTENLLTPPPPPHIPALPPNPYDNTLQPGRLTSSILYTLGAAICFLFLLNVLRDLSAAMKTQRLKIFYSIALMICFVFRAVFFFQFSQLVTTSSLVWVTAGFLFLMCAKVLALCAWHQCGLAFTSRREKFHAHLARFRRIVVIYIVTLTLQAIGLIIWMYVNAEGDGDHPLVDPFTGKLDVTLIWTAYWFGAHNLFLSFASMYFGLRLFLRARAHGFQQSTNIKKLKELSFGAGVICISFAVRGVFDILLGGSTAFENYCLGSHYDTCLNAFFLMTEWAPNFYFQILLFFLSYRRKGSEALPAQRGSLSEPLRPLSSDGKTLNRPYL